MPRSFAIGESWNDLRPFKDKPAPGRTADGFPVYAALERRLAAVRRPALVHRTARHVCAALSAWAYSDVQTVATMLSRLGLERCRVRGFDVANNGLVIRSTAYLVQSLDRRVALLAYRGTDPFDVSAWAVDADVNRPATLTSGRIEVPAPGGGGRSGAHVHAGFYRNQRSSWFDVAGALRRAMDGYSILADVTAQEARGLPPADVPDLRTRGAPLEALFVTGHSLGAAMATLAAFRIAAYAAYHGPSHDVRRILKQVYLFAPPMVGDPAFKLLWNGLTVGAAAVPLDRVTFAHTFERDVVPHVPPQGTHPYAHVGRHHRSDASGSGAAAGAGRWVEQPRPPTACTVREMAGAVAPLLLGHVTSRDLFGPWLGPAVAWASELTLHVGKYSFADHMPANYVSCSQPRGVTSEFGDDF
jgi:hypothetical protein